MRKLFLVLSIVFISSLTLSAQPGNPQVEDPDEQVPITGIEWLIAGGCAIGLKKFLSSKRASSRE
jgi:hypothetical protein